MKKLLLLLLFPICAWAQVTPDATILSNTNLQIRSITTASGITKGNVSNLFDALTNSKMSRVEVYVASGTNTYTVTVPWFQTYTLGTIVSIQFTNSNTGASTLNINSAGAIAIKKNGTSALITGDINNSQIIDLRYDGTNFQIVGGGGINLLSLSAVAPLSYNSSTGAFSFAGWPPNSAGALVNNGSGGLSWSSTGGLSLMSTFPSSVTTTDALSTQGDLNMFDGDDGTATVTLTDGATVSWDWKSKPRQEVKWQTSNIATARTLTITNMIYAGVGRLKIQKLGSSDVALTFTHSGASPGNFFSATDQTDYGFGPGNITTHGVTISGPTNSYFELIFSYDKGYNGMFVLVSSPITYTSQSANQFLASPNGSSGTPTFRAIVGADIPTLNQNTTGSAGSVVNALSIAAELIAGGATSYNGSIAKSIGIQPASVTNAMLAGSITDAKLNSIYLYADGTRALSGDWGVGTFNITGIKSFAISGTAGNGYGEFIAQSSNASAPSGSGFRLFAGSTGSLNWARKNGSDTYVRTFDATLTANRTYTLQDASSTMAMYSNNLSVFASTTSAQLRGVLSDPLGTGADLFDGATPTSFILTNATGLPVSTGISGLGSGVATFLATPTSANLAGALTDETGTGAAVFAGSPAFTGTPTLGTLGYSDTGILFSLQSSTNSYNQVIVQNSSNGASASSNFVVNNDVSTATTHYGEFGKNSSGFSGSGSWNIASATYLDDISDDVAIGTLANKTLHFFTNSATTDNLSITGAGVMTFNGSSTAIHKEIFNSLGTTQTDGAGLWLQNSTTAALGAQQDSPSITQEGRGWATGANTSQAVKVSMFVDPVQAATNPNGVWKFQYAINGGANTDGFSYTFGTASSVAAMLIQGITTFNKASSGSALIVTTPSGSSNSGSDTGGVYMGTNTASKPFEVFSNNGYMTISAIGNLTVEYVTSNSTPDVAVIYGKQRVLTSSWLPVLRFDPGAHTGQSASTEYLNYDYRGATQTAASGTTATQRNFYIRRNTYAGTSGTRTLTDAFGLYVEDNGVGSNAAITNNYALGLDGSFSLMTAGNMIFIKEGTNGMSGRTTLVSGTKAVTITGVTTSDHCFVNLNSASGAISTTDYQCVCTANTITLQANLVGQTINTGDGSTLDYIVFRVKP